MPRIGRRYKRKKEGSSSYVKKNKILTPSPATKPSILPSVKRQRVKYKREGSSNHIAINLSKLMQEKVFSQILLNTSLHRAIYHQFMYIHDIPHTTE